MKTTVLGKSNIKSSRLAYGCMRITGDNKTLSLQKGRQAIITAFEEGYTYFDHADIYADGKSEKLFGEVLKELPEMRSKIIVTSKCGVRHKNFPNEGDPGRYDFSNDHIMHSVEGSLSRLGIEKLDILLLHRPDYLLNAEEVANTFHKLQFSGKVLNFGVSNFSPSQVALLQSFCDMPLIINQVEINIHNICTLTDGTLDQCQQMKITPQAWCPLGGAVYPAWGNTFTEKDKKRIKTELESQAAKYNTDIWIIVLAWLLKHPSKIIPIIGSTNPQRIKIAKKALDINYSREDWYRLLEARNGNQVP
ncbi:MAG: aldo/keto reductase [bacterium]|nr:aldo/keto reductase [bacterium]